MIDERTRFLLHQRLEEQLGTSEAATLMEHLPPVGWTDVATKHDLEQLGVANKHDLEQLRVAAKGDLEQFGAELRGELRSQIHGVRGEIEGLRSEMYKAFADQNRTFVTTLVFSVLGAVTTSSGLAFAAARLAG